MISNLLANIITTLENGRREILSEPQVTLSFVLSRVWRSQTQRAAKLIIIIFLCMAKSLAPTRGVVEKIVWCTSRGDERDTISHARMDGMGVINLYIRASNKLFVILKVY